VLKRLSKPGGLLPSGGLPKTTSNQSGSRSTVYRKPSTVYCLLSTVWPLRQRQNAVRALRLNSHCQYVLFDGSATPKTDI
jgi:hypothetical protein